MRMDVTYIVLSIILLPFIYKTLEYAKIDENDDAKRYRIRILKLWIIYDVILSFLLLDTGLAYNVFSNIIIGVGISLLYFLLFILITGFAYAALYMIMDVYLSWEMFKRVKIIKIFGIILIIISVGVVGYILNVLLYASLKFRWNSSTGNETIKFILNLPSLFLMVLFIIMLFPFMELFINGSKLKSDMESEQKEGVKNARVGRV